jgi:hypothetical protein
VAKAPSRGSRQSSAQPKKPMNARQYAAYKRYVDRHFPERAKRAPARSARTGAVKRTLALNGARQEGDDVKFGRNAPYTKEEKPRLILDDYLTVSDLPPTPAVVDRASEVATWPMYGNDTIGDCTCAATGHEVQAWTRYAGTEVTVPQADIISLYSAVSGYDPATGANDNGCVIQDVLEYWQKNGIPGAGHKIAAFAQLEGWTHDLDLVKTVLNIFGSVYIGLNVPASAETQFSAGQPWTVVADSPIEGGHAVPVQYWGDADDQIGCVTWGALQPMTRDFFTTYVDEVWVVITDDWLDANRETITGLNLAQLDQDFRQLTGQAALDIWPGIHGGIDLPAEPAPDGPERHAQPPAAEAGPADHGQTIEQAMERLGDAAHSARQALQAAFNRV